MARRMPARERRRQLLETAADVFASRGYRGTTTAQLARAAGITEPILYRHFKSKHDLFITLLDEVGDEVIAAWGRSLDEAPSPRKRLEALLSGNPATHERGRGIYRVIFHAMTESDNDPLILRALRTHIARLQGFVEDEIARLQKAGVVRRGDAGSLAAFLVDVAVGYGVLSPLGVAKHGTRADAAAIVAQVSEMIGG